MTKRLIFREESIEGKDFDEADFEEEDLDEATLDEGATLRKKDFDEEEIEDEDDTEELGRLKSHPKKRSRQELKVKRWSSI